MFREHHDAIWSFIQRLAGSTAADDLAAEVFCIAVDRLATFDGARGSQRAWLFGIAANLVRGRARDYERRRRATARVFERSNPNDVSPSTTLLEQEQRSETAAAIRRAVAALPAEQREVLVLAAWEELPYAEIARILDVPIGTVRSRLSRARTAVANFIEQRTPELITERSTRERS